jgi:hypothetical protein
VTPPVPPAVLDLLHASNVRSSMSVGLVVLAVLLAALAVKVVLQSAGPMPRREMLRMIDIVALPLILVFLAIVLERFIDLS